ncbi:MAG: NAD(P)/FAD-dependent oxidoreductase [Rhizomicrobium sp.]
MSESFDVVVIGAGVSGLVAATYLAQAHVRVLVLEGKALSGGSAANTQPLADLAVPAGAHTLCALDPRVVKDLKLARRGLKFAARDMSQVALTAEGKALTLTRNAHAAALSLAPISANDAVEFGKFRQGHFAFARALRAIWWDAGELHKPKQREELRRLTATGAAAFLDATFETEALKAAYAFDAMEGGLSLCDAGSSLLLAWRAAQEMCGLQGAVAVPRGGPAALATSLAAAAEAAGVEIRTNATVTRLLLSGGAASGVAVGNETVLAGVVLSSLSRHQTLLALAPTGAVGLATSRRLLERPALVGEAKLVLGLNTIPQFAVGSPSARFIVADHLASLVAAHADARAGRLPSDLALEAIVPTAFDPSLTSTFHILSVVMRPLPVSPLEGWEVLGPRLADSVVSRLERHAPGLRDSVIAYAFIPPSLGGDRLDVSHIIGEWRTRIATPIDGLFLCGMAAEPVPALSGRAARIAASMAAAYLGGGAK